MEGTGSTAEATILALVPRSESGHQFVSYGDCCLPGGVANFDAINAVLARLRPQPEFVLFAGDHISGPTKSDDETRRQWRMWLDHMEWLAPSIPIYHTTSNHNTWDVASERVWREVFPNLPQNGPVGQEGLSYCLRRGDLLLVAVNTNFSGLGGHGHVEVEWLDRVLSENADALHKIVTGHVPAYTVNGYDLLPSWRIVPDEAKAFWNVLVKHGVLAYLCSHILAFDVQAHQGVLQILTGGAGTGVMPAQAEYIHAVQAAIDEAGLRYQVLDTHGKVREWLKWPLGLAPSSGWEAVPLGSTSLKPGGEPRSKGANRIVAWRFAGTCPPGSDAEDQTLICGWDSSEGPHTFWIGLEGAVPVLKVHLVPEPGAGEQVWRGPVLPPGQPFAFQIAVHSGMGPGGVLYRSDDAARWSSLPSTSARGAERLAWPSRWNVGQSQNGKHDRPFRGSDLQVGWVSSYEHLG